MKKTHLDKIEHKFTMGEINHIVGLLEERRENGSYVGNREQYYKRTHKLINQLLDSHED